MNRSLENIMLSNYLIIAVVIAIALSFVGIIHFFWLRG